jgi:hypothetical protein
LLIRYATTQILKPKESIMYKNILPALLLIGGSTASAQIPTLTAVNSSPVVNDQFITLVCDTTGITQGPPGASITWPFSSLMPSTTINPNKDTGTVIAVTATTTGYSSLQTAATLAGSTTAFNASNIAVITPTGSPVTYSQSTLTALSQTGVYIDASNMLVYTNPLDVLHFPFTMGSTFTDAYAGGLIYSPITATQTGSTTVTADGYGTLVLPGTPSPVTYTGVLRVHSVQTYRDSANLFGTPSVGNYIFDSYTWYQPGYHSALLTISTATGPGVSTKSVSYAYKQLANHAAVPAVPGLASSVNVFPNPANGYIYISYNNAANEKVTTSLTDMLGRQVAVIASQSTQGVTNVTYNTSALAKGIYLVRLQSATETTTRKIEIQ